MKKKKNTNEDVVVVHSCYIEKRLKKEGTEIILTLIMRFSTNTYIRMLATWHTPSSHSFYRSCIYLFYFMPRKWKVLQYYLKTDQNRAAFFTIALRAICNILRKLYVVSTYTWNIAPNLYINTRITVWLVEDDSYYTANWPVISGILLTLQSYSNFTVAKHTAVPAHECSYRYIQNSVHLRRDS